jgi:hypothetical protein
MRGPDCISRIDLEQFSIAIVEDARAKGIIAARRE